MLRCKHARVGAFGVWGTTRRAGVTSGAAPLRVEGEGGGGITRSGTVIATSTQFQLQLIQLQLQNSL
jgi:hypothetical protein